jgi:hypothetical protein
MIYPYCLRCGQNIGSLAVCPSCGWSEQEERRIAEAVAAEREACQEIARQEMLRLQEWERRPHPDHPDEEEKARGGWMAARAIAEAIDAGAGDREVAR